MTAMSGVIDDTARALAVQMAAFESALLLASAFHKTSKWATMRDVVRHFGGVPTSLAPFVLASVAVTEVAAATLLVLPVSRLTGALLAACVWATYLSLIGRAVVQGRIDADCGCSFGPVRRRLGSYQLSRNTALLAMALLVAGSSRLGYAGVQPSQVLAACALLALYGALDQVMAGGGPAQ